MCGSGSLSAYPIFLYRRHVYSKTLDFKVKAECGMSDHEPNLSYLSFQHLFASSRNGYR